MKPEDLHRLVFDILDQGTGAASYDAALVEAIAPFLHKHELEPKIDRESRYREPAPTIYSGHRCEKCGEKGSCFSVLCSLKCGGHYISGNKMLCMSCMEVELAELKGECDCLVGRALQGGRISPNQKPWALSY